MTQGAGLTPFAWAFMLVSMGAVTLLMLWCFYRILSTPTSASYERSPSRSPETDA